LFTTRPAPPPHTPQSEREALHTPGTLSKMGKKSREKRAKKIERDREKEAKGKLSEGPSSSSAGASTSTSRVTTTTPSADDTHDDERASTAVNASDSAAAVAEKLRAFCKSCKDRLGEDIRSWVDGVNAVKAAAERGDAKAQYAVGFLMIYGGIPDDGDDTHHDGSTWLRKAAAQGYADAILALGVLSVVVIFAVRGFCPQGHEEMVNNRAKTYLTKSAVDHNSTDAQYTLGMFECFLHGCARSKPTMLKTARWFRMAAHQGLKEAQWELGEWFRRCVFCDVHMSFARKYIRRASKQGHAEALARMAELRRCVCCGAEGAARKCKLCLEARYCDAACAARHWRDGGGCVVGGYQLLSAPHKTACPRTYAADGAGSDSGGDGE
jgi:hypothetical protein